MQTLVIGDIHGCYEELQALLDKAGLASSDAIISIGDLVDRGPETPQVLDFFRENAAARALLGNHESKHVRAARGELKLALSQQISRQQFGAAYPPAVAWMAGLPLCIELPEAVLAHGYLEPGLALDQQNRSVLCGTMGGDKLLRERYERPWYEIYDGQKPAIVGHHNYTGTDQPFIYRDKVFGLDTNCVNGKALTGLLLPSFRFIAVPSRGDLWLQVRRAYRAARPPARQPSRPAVPWSQQDDLALEQMIDKVRQANESLLARLLARPGFAELSARQQAKLYAFEAGPGAFATLMQLARLDKLDLETAHRILKEPGDVQKILAQHPAA